MRRLRLLVLVAAATTSLGRCPAHCSGRGACGSDGRCKCDEGFAGAACSRAVPACLSACSGHGACLSRGVCACDRGFSGSDCSILVPDACPLGCSGRGLCGPSAECICEPGFTGPACERVGSLGAMLLPPASPSPSSPARTFHLAAPSRGTARFAPSPSLCPANCSSHGACRRGRCSCHPGFGGDACQTALPLCPANCSGHGECEVVLGDGGGGDDGRVQQHPQGRCRCAPTHSGDDCSTLVPSWCPLGCSAHGVCAADGCSCRDGMAPPACQYRARSTSTTVS